MEVSGNAASPRMSSRPRVADAGRFRNRSNDQRKLVEASAPSSLVGFELREVAAMRKDYCRDPDRVSITAGLRPEELDLVQWVSLRQLLRTRIVQEDSLIIRSRSQRS